MHKRSFLIGIGIGIIVGALLLELFDLGEKSQQQLQDIEQQLNETSSPTPTPSHEPSAMPETDVDSASPSSPQPADIDDPQSPEAPEAPQASEVEEQEAPSIEAVDEPKVSSILRVYPGDSITKTGNQLAEHGIISDADDFVTYFREHDATIRAGFFLVEQESDLSDLLLLFASQPLTEDEANEQIAAKGIALIR